ncbi:MAG: bifunctional nuclease family protein [Paludibacteraceae bacterium]|nr:bifunctional nuclease family protein [Paludibacteraceae bacterium]
MASEIRIHIAGMIYNQSLGGTYSLVLSEDGGQKRRFSVLIGESEAQSIALKLNNAKSPRPLSHDLMNSIIRELHAKVVKVVIYDLNNDIFYSEIYLIHDNKPVIIDARTSDAVALAVRCDAPIYIHSDILDIVGTAIDEEKTETEQPIEEDLLRPENLNVTTLKKIGTEKLKDLLEVAIEEERYEIAAMIRDEIEKRK